MKHVKLFEAFVNEKYKGIVIDRSAYDISQAIQKEMKLPSNKRIKVKGTPTTGPHEADIYDNLLAKIRYGGAEESENMINRDPKLIELYTKLAKKYGLKYK